MKLQKQALETGSSLRGSYVVHTAPNSLLNIVISSDCLRHA